MKFFNSWVVGLCGVLAGTSTAAPLLDGTLYISFNGRIGTDLEIDPSIDLATNGDIDEEQVFAIEVTTTNNRVTSATLGPRLFGRPDVGVGPSGGDPGFTANEITAFTVLPNGNFAFSMADTGFVTDRGDVYGYVPGTPLQPGVFNFTTLFSSNSTVQSTGFFFGPPDGVSISAVSTKGDKLLFTYNLDQELLPGTNDPGLFLDEDNIFSVDPNGNVAVEFDLASDINSSAFVDYSGLHYLGEDAAGDEFALVSFDNDGFVGGLNNSQNDIYLLNFSTGNLSLFFDTSDFFDPTSFDDIVSIYFEPIPSPGSAAVMIAACIAGACRRPASRR